MTNLPASSERVSWLRNLTRPGPLGRLSKGNPKRAPLVLIVVHLLPLAVVALIWFVGLAPVFDNIHWIPAILATIVAVAVPLPMMYAFGFWGVGASNGHDGGDQFDDDFEPLVAFGLGWLRWLLQLLLIGGLLLGTIFIWFNFRPWYILGSPEIDAMPQDLASMPIPNDWEQVGQPSDGWKRDHMAYTKPHAELELSFYAPFTYEQMKAWVNDSNAWDQSEFSAIDHIECDDSLQWCDADQVAPPGQPREYTMTFRWDDTPGVTDDEGKPLSEVRIELSYAEDGQAWN